MSSQGEYRITGLSPLLKTLRGTDRDITNVVKRVNRKWTNVIRDKIRAKAPRTGGYAGLGLRARRKSAKKKTGPSHDTRAGAFRASVKSRVGSDYGRIEGGGPKAPHFVVNEFGGAVWWHKMGRGASRSGSNARQSNRVKQANFNVGHIIPGRKRSPMVASGSFRQTGRSFPSGWYFFPTVTSNVDEVFAAYWHELCQTLDHHLHSGGGSLSL